MSALSLRFWVKFFITATAITIAMATHCECFAAYEAGSNNKRELEGGEHDAVPAFHFIFIPFPSICYSTMFLSPSLTDSKNLWVMEKLNWMNVFFLANPYFWRKKIYISMLSKIIIPITWPAWPWPPNPSLHLPMCLESCLKISCSPSMSKPLPVTFTFWSLFEI